MTANERQYGVTGCHRSRSGALLAELFTREGDGILITRDVFEDIRTAQTSEAEGVPTIKFSSSWRSWATMILEVTDLEPIARSRL